MKKERGLFVHATGARLVLLHSSNVDAQNEDRDRNLVARHAGVCCCLSVL